MTLTERLNAKLKPNLKTGCIEWTGTINDNGYGVLGCSISGKWHTLKTHRVAWELVWGTIPTGLGVLHHCDNPRCCNVAHLFLGDHAANMRDAATKRRMKHGGDHYAAKLTEEVVIRIRREFVNSKTIKAIARDEGINRLTARLAVRGITWSHVAGSVSKRACRPKKLTIGKARIIRKLYVAGVARKLIAKRFNVSVTNVKLIGAGKIWLDISP